MKSKELCENFGLNTKEYEDVNFSTNVEPILAGCSLPNWIDLALDFGKYYNTQIFKVPKDYLIWMATNLFDVKFQDRRHWAIRAMSILKHRYSVTYNEFLELKHQFGAKNDALVKFGCGFAFSEARIFKMEGKNFCDLLNKSNITQAYYPLVPMTEFEVVAIFEVFYDFFVNSAASFKAVKESDQILSIKRDIEVKQIKLDVAKTSLALLSSEKDIAIEQTKEEDLAFLSRAKTFVPEYPTRWIAGTKVAIKKYDVGDCRRIGRVVNIDTSKKPFIYSIETDYSASSGSYLENELTDVFDKAVERENPVEQSKFYPLAITIGILAIAIEIIYYFATYRV